VASGDPLLTAQALQRLGLLELMHDCFDRIGDRFERALAIHRRFKDWHEVALTLRWMGGLARKQGNLTQSLAYYQESTTISRAQGNRVYLAASLQEGGCVFYEQGEYTQAKAAFTEALTLFRQPGGEYGIGFGCNLLGSTLLHLGEYARARELHREALALYHASSNIEGITWSLERLAVLEAADGDAQKAARLLGAASVGREGLGKPLDRWDQEDWDRAIVSVRAALGEAIFTSLWAEGRTLTLEQAVVYALTLT
jgi:tetratricopeptide (TPR) repeat protein